MLTNQNNKKRGTVVKEKATSLYKAIQKKSRTLANIHKDSMKILAFPSAKYKGVAMPMLTPSLRNITEKLSWITNIIPCLYV